MVKKVKYILMVLAGFSFNHYFSQSNSQVPFNASFWNSYADKIQLQGKDREEFINSHKRLHSQVPIVVPQNTQQPQISQKGVPQSTAGVFAGPCINADFESGNLSGWTRSCGFHPGFNPLGCCPNPNGQQTIMTGAGLDPAGGFPVVFPGGNFSLRLGNAVNGGEADRIEQTFLVSPANANFSYKYAVVFEDPNHPANQQPSFQVEMLDTTGAQVPCTFYYVAAGAGIPGFQNSTIAGVIYKPWTTVLVDLTPYIGQNITIRFSTYDCSLGGHYGYAYIDGVCQAFTGGGAASICAGASTTFCAPQGVASYTWTGPGVANIQTQCCTASAAGIYTVQTTLISGCQGPTFMYTLTTQPQPTATAGPNATVCANNNAVVLNGSITGFTSTPVWSSSGSGAFTATNVLNPTYTPSNGDNVAGGVTLSLTTAGNGLCPPSTSTMAVIITPSPGVNAGTGGSACSSGIFNLNGTVTGGASTGSWTTNGNGTFSPSANVLNPSYTPGSLDIAAGSVTLTLTSTGNGNCLAVSDTVIILIKQPSTSNAGPNQTVCSTSPTIGLSGIIGGGTTTGVWGTTGGGSFNPNNTNLNATYSITPGNIAAGQVTFTLTSTNNGPCPAVTDTVKMVILQPVVVNAGANQFVCAPNGTVNLNGTVTGYTNTGIWSSNGTGSFNPGNTSLSTTYSFSTLDIANGTVIFTLTSTNNVACAPVVDTVMIKVRQPAIVNAGPNLSLCSNNPNIALTGTVSGGGTTGVWSSSGIGGYAPSNTALNTTYGMTALDIAASTVVFTLTSTNNGPCPAVADTIMMVVSKIATLTAGPNQLLCSNAGVINLSGSVNSSSNTAIWNSNGAGAFNPGNTNPVTSYSITSADILAGTVAFTLTSTNNGACPVVSDSVLIALKTLAVVNAGPNQSLCSNTSTIGITGVVNGGTSGTTTGLWSTSGAGAFIPGASSLNNTYFVGGADMSQSALIYTLTSTNNGPCPAVSDTMQVFITPLPVVNAGPNQFLCSTAGTIALTGVVNSNAGTGLWTSSGGGTYTPSAATLNPVYSITPSDASNGSVTFTLSSTNSSPCPVIADTVLIKIKKPAVVNAGPNFAVCSTTPSGVLSGSISGGGTGIWSSNGSGSFSPSQTALNATYIASPLDVFTGTVNLILSSTNDIVCPSASDTTKLTVIKSNSISLLSDTSVCSYQNPVKLTANVNGGSGQYLWTSTGTGSLVYSGGFNSVVYTMSAADISSGFIKLTISSVNSAPCSEVNASINIKVNPSPVANFIASSYVANIPNDPISFTNQSTGANSYIWNFGDGGSSTIMNPVYNYINTGFFTVNLIAINQFNCRDTVEHDIKVISDFQFPNVFTPNANGGNGGGYTPGDLSNDVFFPYTSGVTEYELMIFNRWGELIFSSKDVNIGWDGYFNGKICQQDAYVWKANVKFFDGRTFNKTGTVTLLR